MKVRTVKMSALTGAMGRHPATDDSSTTRGHVTIYMTFLILPLVVVNSASSASS